MNSVVLDVPGIDVLFVLSGFGNREQWFLKEVRLADQLVSGRTPATVPRQTASDWHVPVLRR